jgi:DNA-binding CsgD family transcriptional regulator
MTARSARTRFAVLGAGAFALLLTVDVLTEGEPIPLGEFLANALETALIVASATGVALLTGSFRSEREEKETLTRDLRLARAEGETWRGQAQTYLSGLGEAIEAQFEGWELTSAEREVALLMLKGFAAREIAGLRGTTEATVRHQSRAVYQKSGMPSRSTFCAYFLEDLLPSRAPVPVSLAVGRKDARSTSPPAGSPQAS